MKRLIVAVLLATSGPAVAATIVPLQTGTYVLAGTPCRDAPFAAIMRYDGKGLSDPHSAQCRSRILTRSGRRYRVATTCRANGDGSPATPTTEIATLRVRTRGVFAYAAAGAVAPGPTYRLCPPGSADR